MSHPLRNAFITDIVVVLPLVVMIIGIKLALFGGVLTLNPEADEVVQIENPAYAESAAPASHV
ncbi:MAG: hypothetical protein ACI9ZV_000129 [Candidatus Azotimanducaceae bacterium]|jgi:hypothetical protein